MFITLLLNCCLIMNCIYPVFAEAPPDDMPPLEGDDDDEDASRMEEVD